GWGIAVVCGSGINCLGVAPDLREARFDALGEISGDWGGGADLGMAALGAAARSADGRGPKTLLERAVPEHFGLTEALEVSRAVHLKLLPVERLGELAAVVLAASPQDAVAAAIIRRLSDEVIAFALAAIRRLQLAATDPDVVLGGRVLRSVPASVIEAIAEGVRSVAPAARVIVSPSEPIVGAALLALDALAAGPATSPEVSERARNELDSAAAKLPAAQQASIR